jgi:hypothetical protein
MMRDFFNRIFVGSGHAASPPEIERASRGGGDRPREIYLAFRFAGFFAAFFAFFIVFVFFPPDFLLPPTVFGTPIKVLLGSR